jgi:hypothetical protein
MAGGGQQTVVKETSPWKAQRGYLEKGFGQAEQMYDRGLPAYYPGETTAGFDPAQKYAQTEILDYAGGPRTAAMQAGAENALLGAMAGQTPFSGAQMTDLLAGDVRTGAGTPYTAMEEALTSGVMGNLQGNVLPGIRESLVRYQPGGSSRGDLVQNKAIADAVSKGMTMPMAQMYSDAYGQAQADRFGAAGMQLGQRESGMRGYPSIMGAPLGMYGAAADVGAQRQTESQRAIDAAMGRYDYDAQKDYNALNQYMNTIAGNYGGTTTQTSPRGGGFMNLLGSLGSAAIMASDVRVKENIEKDGATLKGYPVYRYNYVGDPTPRRGVMAQDVEKHNPGAVGEFGGVKHVNYGAL